MTIAIILGVSIALQFAAALLALRLIRPSGGRAAWILIATAVSLMAVRRSIVLFRLLAGDLTHPPDLAAELVALLISVLMLCGIAWIAPLFLSIKRSEASLRESSDKLRDLVDEQKFLLDNMHDFLYRHDTAGVFYYLSPSIEQVSGHTADEWKKHYTAYMTDHPDNEKVIAYTEDSIRTGKASPPYPVEVYHKNGSRITLEVSERPYFAQGEVAGIIGIARDITERLNAEEERNRLAEQLRQSQKMEALGHLAGGVAHDFNNLLTAILGVTEMLLSKLQDGERHPPPETIKDGLEEVRRAGERAAALTGQLLAFSRKQVAQPRLLNPGHVVGEMESLLRRLIGEDITLTVHTAPNVAHIVIDEAQFQQILMNLVINAVDAVQPGGQVGIDLRNVSITDAVFAARYAAKLGDYVVLTVTDDGEGMTEETMQRAFEPFFTTKSVGKGTGLGLATTYGTTIQAGGFIAIDSGPGQGASFRVHLPASVERAARPVEDRPTADVSGSGVVLVCEDEPLVREVICRTLRGGGYTVITADNGRAALEAAALHRDAIDLLITDVIMPEMNGFDLANALTKEREGLKTLFVSGYTSDLLDEGRVRAKHEFFLAKPFRTVTLLNRVRAVLASEPQRERGASRSDSGGPNSG